MDLDIQEGLYSLVKSKEIAKKERVKDFFPPKSLLFLFSSTDKSSDLILLSFSFSTFFLFLT